MTANHPKHHQRDEKKNLTKNRQRKNN